MNAISSLAEAVLLKMESHTGERLFTVAISGIDGAGKGHISRLLQEELEQRGLAVATIHIDPWQNPIPLRLRKEDPAYNIYHNIFRWKDFFEQLIFPLQWNKRIRLETKGIRSDADEYYPLVYDHPAPDILLVEGILLFKKEYLSFYDHKIWIGCSFETALQRALQRNVEQLSKERLIHDYEVYYHAAQRLHIQKDDPEASADLIFDNDPEASAG